MVPLTPDHDVGVSLVPGHRSKSDIALSHNRDWQNNNKLDWAFNNVRLMTGILALTWFKVQEFGCSLFRAIVSIV